MPRFVFDDVCLAHLRCVTWPGWKSWRLHHPHPVVDWIRLVAHPPTASLATWLREHAADDLREALARDAIGVLLPDDTDWPVLWHHIPDPPAVCFVRGTWNPEWLQTAIAVVGTRKPTSYGRTCLERLIRGLAAYPVSIVSGLALGIDGAAHEEALLHGLPAIAVLGSGLDDHHITPPSHFSLGMRLLERGGCLLSEYPPGTSGLPRHFPERNRLIASLARSVLVIEAAQDSGSLITAKIALEYGRDVFAVPGPIWSPTSDGCHELIKQGASVCTSSADLLERFTLDQAACVRHAQRPLPMSARDPLAQTILEALREPRTLDALHTLLPVPITDILARLSTLELDGMIENMGDLWHMRS